MVFSLFVMITSCSDTTQNPLLEKQEFCTKIHRNDSISLSKILAEFDAKMQKQTGVYVLEDGGGSLVTRAWLCEYAEKTIDIQYFIFSMDNVGLISCDYLVRAADRGVKVQILVDDFMVDADLEDILTLDSHENIDIKIYNPGVNLGKNLFGKLRSFATDYRGANQRMHNKTLTIDGQIVISGGRNVANEYFDYDHAYNFRDRDVLFLGKAVKQVNTSFSTFWNDKLSVPITTLAGKKADNALDTKRFDKLHDYACNPDNFSPIIRNQIEHFETSIQNNKGANDLIWVDNLSFISDNPGKNAGQDGLEGGGITTSALIELVEKAKFSIDIQTPYLITTKESRKLFQQATKRGVKVRILTNSLASTDNLEAFAGYQKDRRKLLETGVEIYEFRPDAAERVRLMTSVLQDSIKQKPVFGLHAKTMVVDGETTVIGTFNFDPRSINLNTECISIIPSVKVAKRVLKGFNQEFKPENSWQTTLDYNPDSEVKRSKRLKSWTRKIIPKNIL